MDASGALRAQTGNTRLQYDTVMKLAADYFMLVSQSLWSISRPHAQYVVVAADSLPLSWTEWQTLGFCLLAVVDLCMSSVWMPSCSVHILHRANGVQHLPANQTEPREAVIKGVAACHHVFTVFSGVVGHISGAIIHLSHEVEPLPARSSNKCHIKSLHWKEAQHGVDKKCSSSEYCDITD